MPVNLAQIKNELLPGLYEVAGQYKMIETQWKRLFKVQKSTLAVETKTQMRFLALAAIKTEGGPTSMDNNAGQRFAFNAESFEVGLGYAVTRKAIDDNQYKTDFPLANLGLQDSFRQFKEIQAANILNNATTYDSSIGGDGVALSSASHPYDLGTWGNTFGTQLDLNESSLLQACLNVRSNFVNEAGLKIYARPKEDGLTIPVALIPVADRLVKTELRPGTANNDINALRSMEGGVRNYVTNDYLTSNYAWFLRTNIDGLVMMERIAFETDMQVDFSTDNLLCKGYERYTPTYNDPRCLYISTPTS